MDGDNLSDHYTWDADSDVLVSDGAPIPLSGDAAAHQLQDYDPVSGTLTFNDFEMSKTIRIPIVDDFGLERPNRDFGIVLFDPADFKDRATYADPHQYPSGARTTVIDLLDGRMSELDTPKGFTASGVSGRPRLPSWV